MFKEVLWLFDKSMLGICIKGKNRLACTNPTKSIFPNHKGRAYLRAEFRGFALMYRQSTSKGSVGMIPYPLFASSERHLGCDQTSCLDWPQSKWPQMATSGPCSQAAPRLGFPRKVWAKIASRKA